MPETTTKTTGKDAIGEAIGRIPSGVFVVTAKRKSGEPVGLLSSWVAQAGFEPAAVSVAVHPDREIYSVIEESGTFCINVLSNENMNLLRAFSKYSPEQFEGLDTTDTANGVILNEAVAVIQCRVMAKFDKTDHHLFVAEVVEGDYMDHEQSPMVHLRKSGFQY